LAFKISYFYALLKNNEGSKRKAYKIMTKKMFATMDTAKPDTGGIRS